MDSLFPLTAGFSERELSSQGLKLSELTPWLRKTKQLGTARVGAMWKSLSICGLFIMVASGYVDFP